MTTNPPAVRKLIIIGAGASYDCGIQNKEHHPPLANEFMTGMQAPCFSIMALTSYVPTLPIPRTLKLIFSNNGTGLPTTSTPIWVIQEQTNNITKYTHASEVGTAVNKNANSLQLTIQDNGRGFDPKQVKKALVYPISATVWKPVMAA